MDYSYITVRFLGKTDADKPLYIDNIRVMDSDLPGTGVDSIHIDRNDDVVFFDLNGYRVKNPQKGSVYVLRHADGHTEKVIF